MSEVLTKTTISTPNPKSALKSNDMSAQNSGASKAAGINAGSRVKITGTNYATGQAIPGWVKQNTHTVQQVSGNRALLKEIYSWVYISDLVAEGSSAPKTQAPKSDAKAPESKTNTPESKTPASATKRTPLDNLLASNPGVKTHQDLINLFFRMSDNTFNGAAAVARTYGVDLNSLTYNRQAPVSGATATQNPTQSNTGGTTQNNPPAVSTNGVPLFKQGDPQWSGNKLGSSSTIGKVGCAMTSTAMVLSKLKGQYVYPNELNSYLMKNGGYSGNCIYWGVAAGYIGKRYTAYSYTKSVVDNELNSGRPMVISVRSEGHWVCVAGRKDDGTYIIHDPGDGQIHTGQWSNGHIAVSGYTAGSCLRTFG